MGVKKRSRQLIRIGGKKKEGEKGKGCGLPADVCALGIVAIEILGNGPSHDRTAL